MSVDLVVEPVLCLLKKEATGANENLHQGATSLRDIQYQGNMDSYTGTISIMHAIVMDILPINDQINNQKHQILQLLELC